MLHDLDLSNATNLEHFVAGADDSVLELASLVMRHIKCVTRRDSPVTDTTGVLIAAIIKLLEETKHHQALQDELFRQGIVPTLTATLRTLAVATFQGATTLIHGVFTHFLQYMITAPFYLKIASGLKAGLLHAIILYGAQDIEGTRVYLRSALRDVLPASLVYHRVVSQIEKSLPEIKEMALNPRFQASYILGDWQRFLDLTEARLAVLGEYDSGKCTSHQSCDNLEASLFNSPCDKVLRIDVRCCASCQKAWYCSKVCQRLDWRSLQGPPSSSLEFPGRQCYMHFDYSAGTARIDVRLVDTMPVSENPTPFEAQWLDQVSRAVVGSKTIWSRWAWKRRSCTKYCGL
ncbi:hypothetical protein B0H10DRAFT_1959341 [Mycena sp. CBHHK59/15]|nr:hypothetical protein B0H10DRAFT_1959341 [Mycena sp. CBHHK59/15]